MTEPPVPRNGLGARFWKVWTAATVSNVGDGIVLAAVPLLASELTRDPAAVAATTIFVRLPWLAFGLFAGVLVDRIDRLRTMISIDAARGLTFGVMAFVVATDGMTLPVLYGAVFVVGVLETLFDTAAMSVTPSVVRRDQLEIANARISGANIAANEFVGPVIGAALFALAAATPFAVNAATFLLSVAILATVGGSYRPRRAAERSVLGDIKAGFGFVWHEPLIRTFAIGAGMINLGFTAAISILVLHAQDNLGLGDVGFGVLVGSAAVGGVLGAQLAPRTIRLLGRRMSVLASVAVLSAGLAVMGAGGSIGPALAGYAAFGFAGEVWNVVSVTYRQSVTPGELMGRVMSGFRVIAYGAFPIGAALGGTVASATTLRTTFFVGAGIIATLIPLLASTTRRHDLDGAPASG